MKRLSATLLVLSAFLAGCADEPTGPATEGLDLPTASQLGNGFPEGGHDYKLNIIGVPKEKSAAMDDNSGHRIFVLLEGGQPVCVTDEDWAAYLELLGEEPSDNPYACTEEEWEDALHGGRGKATGGWDALDKVNKILLTPNSVSGVEGFQVLDANATDKDGAEFTMPDDVGTSYRVYARALGTPGGKAAITLCANETEETTDETTETWCSINQAVLTREKGQPRAEDVTDMLFTLTILVDVDDAKDVSLTACLDTAGLIDAADTELQVADVPIFHACFEDYFWNYDNHGLKLLELRFYAQ